MFYRRGTDPIKIVLSFFTIYLLHSSWRATHTELRKIFINTDLINSVCFLSFHISEIVTRLQIWREKLQVRFTTCDWTVETDPELSFVENWISNLNHHFTFH